MGLCSQPKQPDPNPGLLASAQASERVAMEQLNLAREQFAWAKEQAGEDREFIRPFLDQQMRIADQNEARAQDYYNYEKSVYRPLEMGIVEEAKAFDTEGTRERISREAAADIESQLGTAKATTARDAARYGLTSGGAFADAMTKMNLQGGLAKAQAQTNARTQAKALGHAMKMDAAQMGRGLAGNASTAYGIALNANQGAQQGQLNASAQANQMRLGGIDAYGGAQRGFGQAGNLYGNEYGLRLQGYDTAMKGYGSMMQGIGSMAGMAASALMFSDGGKASKARQRVARSASIGGLHTMHSGPKSGPVKGPGTGISDSIDAKLSDGEYVIPADVVRQLGTKHFDKYVEKYHTPAHVQREMGGE